MMVSHRNPALLPGLQRVRCHELLGMIDAQAGIQTDAHEDALPRQVGWHTVAIPVHIHIAVPRHAAQFQV